MYTLVRCKATTKLFKIVINGAGTDMAATLKTNQSERFKGFPEKVKTAIARNVLVQFSFYKLGTVASPMYF